SASLPGHDRVAEKLGNARVRAHVTGRGVDKVDWVEGVVDHRLETGALDLQVEQLTGTLSEDVNPIRNIARVTKNTTHLPRLIVGRRNGRIEPVDSAVHHMA